MKMRLLAGLTACGFLGLAPRADEPASQPYKILKMTQTLGTGGIDYVFADNLESRLYIPRGSEVLVFDLDSLEPAGAIANTRARGVAIDPESHHAFSSSTPVAMWDSRTLRIIKTIDVQGAPDGILFEPLTKNIYVFSHRPPNATILDSKTGDVVGTLDLGGAPEQAQSDGRGRLYVDLEDKDRIAVVDAKARRVVANYGLGGKGGTPAGLALDNKNGILFAMCRSPQTCVALNAADGKILAALPIGKGSDGALFLPATGEVFSSQGDGTLTIIKETSPATFVVEQTLQTKPRAKTCALDTKNNHVILIATEPAPASSRSVEPPPGGQRSPRSGSPAFLDILRVGRK